MKNIPIDYLFTLCNEMNWYTSGDIQQYSKLFEAAKNGASVHDLAIMIWLCSTDVTLEDVEARLAEDEACGLMGVTV